MNISIDELFKLDSPNIIDIRSVENYNNNHMPGARNIPYNKLLLEPNKYLNKNEKYYIYCRYGKTSQGLCRILRNQGFDVYSITGGYESWMLNKYNE